MIRNERKVVLCNKFGGCLEKWLAIYEVIAEKRDSSNTRPSARVVRLHMRSLWEIVVRSTLQLQEPIFELFVLSRLAMHMIHTKNVADGYYPSSCSS